VRDEKSEEAGVLIILLVICVISIIGVVCAALEPEKHTINISEPMTVTASNDGVHHWALVTIEDRAYELKEGDKLIVTSDPVRGFTAIGKGGAYTHVRGWLSDGTRVDVPLSGLKKQGAWRSGQ